MFAQISSGIATFMFVWTICQQFLPPKLRESIEFYTSRYTSKFAYYFSPYLDITFHEQTDDGMCRSDVYTAIQNYLGDKSSEQARSMKADYIEDGKSLLVKLGDNEEIMDDYLGVSVWWSFTREVGNQPSYPFYNGSSAERRYYSLVFHGKHRKFVLDTYLPYVLEEGEAIAARKRTQKLFTNAGHNDFGDSDIMWNHIEFKHPASFEMLAMEDSKKEMILDDLQWFKSAKDYYAQIGKPWKRGYLLYGPPGTGKSTLVVAMANFLNYDIYDLELTSVRDNMQLRKLLIETTSKSIILIEDIDCSLDLTGQRKKKNVVVDLEDEKDPLNMKIGEEEGVEKRRKQVTLSGLLNFIDGIWSACGEERIIVFTTNHVDKLDPALIRPGRMDLHIELSYCRYEAFKVLAKNYLGLESHSLFETIEKLLEETKVTPAEVAENLMPRSLKKPSIEDSLQNLVKFLDIKASQEKKLQTDHPMMLQGGKMMVEDESEKSTSNNAE